MLNANAIAASFPVFAGRAGYDRLYCYTRGNIWYQLTAPVKAQMPSVLLLRSRRVKASRRVACTHRTPRPIAAVSPMAVQMRAVESPQVDRSNNVYIIKTVSPRPCYLVWSRHVARPPSHYARTQSLSVYTIRLVLVPRNK